MSIGSIARTAGKAMPLLWSEEGRRHLATSINAYRHNRPAECPCCGFSGRFLTGGSAARIGAMCPSCSSYERHRLFAIASSARFIDLSGKEVLHFAPEKGIASLVKRASPARYVTADLRSGRAANLVGIRFRRIPEIRAR